MIRIVAFFCAIFALVTADFAAGTDTLDGKQLLTGGFPMGFVFRGETDRAAHKDYGTWTTSLQDGCGFMQKFMSEELPHQDPLHAQWANRYVQEHPEKTAILHLNLESRQVTMDQAVHQRYFPGHWVYEPGAKLLGDVAANATELKVDDIAPFKVKAYRDHSDKSDTPQWFSQIVCLVPIDPSGGRDWYNSEYATLDAIDAQKKTLTVKRAQLFSAVKPFAANRTYIAPMAGNVWGGGPMAYYNLSTLCPKDRNGHTAADVFAGEIAQWFSPNGPLAHFDGIGGDVNYWIPRQQEWDVNNDGKPDGGIVGGANVWRLGDYQFLTQVRRAIGDNRLFTSDGQNAGNQQAVGVLDGVESEGLVQPDDAFRGISRTLNTQLYWAENTPRAHDFRYVVLKVKNPADAERTEQLQRFGVGVACCIGARTTLPPAGILPEKFAAIGSLGSPVGPLLRLAKQTPDLLRGHGLEATFEAHRGALAREENHLLLTPADREPMTLTLKNLAVPPGDVTLFLDVQSLDPLDGFDRGNLAPRRIDVAFSHIPNYGESDRNNAMYTDVYGFFGTQRRSVMSFYLRRPSQPAQTLDVTFTMEGRGRACIYGLAAHGAADALVRSFAHGVVAVNPSLAPLDVSLQGAGGGSGAVPASVRVPALDAVFFSK